MDVRASTAIGQAEVTAAQRMIERAGDRHNRWARDLTGDTDNGSADMDGIVIKA